MLFIELIEDSLYVVEKTRRKLRSCLGSCILKKSVPEKKYADQCSSYQLNFSSTIRAFPFFKYAK